MVLHPKFRDFYHIAKKEGDNTFDVFYNPSGKKVTSHVLWAQLEFKGNFDTYQDAYEGVETIERRDRQKAIDELESFRQKYLNDQQQS
jgi:hypothetical protein